MRQTSVVGNCQVTASHSQTGGVLGDVPSAAV